MQGTTEAVFQVTGGTPTGIAFAGDITFTTNRATLTVDLEGALRPGDWRVLGVGRREWGHR